MPSETNAENPGLTIFDRPRDSHPWARAFAELARLDPDLDASQMWAIYANWKMDPRVAPEREKELLESDHFQGVEDAGSWWAARYQYFREALCRPWTAAEGERPAVYVEAPNRANRIRSRIAGYERLVHVASLNRMLSRILRRPTWASVALAVQRSIGHSLPFRSAGTNGGQDMLVNDFAKKLKEAGVAAVQAAAGLFADALGDRQPPWWACFAYEVDELIAAADATALAQALGLGHLRPGEWLVIWQYEVRQAGPLYRPTVIEANDSPYHYPSPPSFELGVAMPLDSTAPAYREVIHPPLRGEAARSACTGQLLRLEDFPVISHTDLKALRLSHRSRLQEELDAESWLNRHTHPP